MTAMKKENIFRSDTRKQIASDGKKSATSLFGKLRHRALANPVSIEEMETAINKRRSERAAK